MHGVNVYIFAFSLQHKAMEGYLCYPLWDRLNIIVLLTCLIHTGNNNYLTNGADN